jgi:membrane-associated phospholipid phosphatase
MSHRDAELGAVSWDRRPDARTVPATPSQLRATARHGRIAQVLIAWAPLSVILILYAAAQWINAPLATQIDGPGTNWLGFGLHVAGPAQFDARLFGTVPSVWLQQRLVDGPAHWYDAAAALVYITHFISIPLVTAVVWFRLRDWFATWVTAVLAMTALGVAGYIVFPSSPPWLASDDGVIGTVHRISGLGWNYLHLEWMADLTASGQDGSNPVAAMPSLHAGTAVLVALFFWRLANTPWRAALLGYVLLMAVTLIYSGEHYVVDVLAGWTTAGLAVAAAVWVSRHRADRCADADPDPLDRLDPSPVTCNADLRAG